MKKSMKVAVKKDFHFEKIYNFRDIGGVQTEMGGMFAQVYCTALMIYHGYQKMI